MSTVRLVAIGDSFTEGIGDELPDGTVRGWADLAAQGWANALGEPIEYANLAIRGRLIWPIIDEQLEPALALKPTHLSFVGGGNDMIRPRTTIAHVADAFTHVMRRCAEEGVQAIVHTGADPSASLPMSRLIHSRGTQLADAVIERAASFRDVPVVLNWTDRDLAGPGNWAEDRLHMNTRGHHRVAARFLTTAGIEPPSDWWDLSTGSDTAVLGAAAFYRVHLGPWVRRRLTGRSSGDGREAKYADWVGVAPST
ncbi:MAG: SGNH/GDSL hydrolase family protein [Propionicimonas sp.]|nr:SGNH/GDSL hydrolase family protein [Propionicimonas sp.]